MWVAGDGKPFYVCKALEETLKPKKPEDLLIF